MVTASTPPAFKPGDFVTVGPAYRMGGAYVPDGYEGHYTVLERCGDDYALIRGQQILTPPYSDYNAHVYIIGRRLTLAGES